jgi:all-trans-retinol 13,14-reductase
MVEAASPELLQHLPTAQTKRRVRTKIPEDLDVAIIGAGTGSLAAAAYLAKQGLKVACFDYHYVAGGCATQFSRGSGSRRYIFDIGLHYVGDTGEGGMFQSLLSPLGIDIDFVPLDEDGFDTLIFPDFEFKIPTDRDLFRQRLLDLFPEEQRGIDRYLRLMREVESIGRKLFDNYGRLGPGVLWHILTRGHLMLLNQHATIEGFLDSCTKNPKLRAVLLGQHGDYGMPPSEASAVLHTGVCAHLATRPSYPKGGGQVISDRLADVVEAHEGAIVLRRGVSKILIEGGRAVGVRTEGKKGETQDVRAKVVLSGADIKQTFLELVGPEHLPKRHIKKAEDWIMAGSLFMTCVAVNTDMRAKGMRAANYWELDGYDLDSYYKAERETDFPRAHGSYITSSSLKDPETPWHAPPGVTAIEIMTLVHGGAKCWGISQNDIASGDYSKKDAYLERKQALEDDMIARLERQFPGTKEHIEFCESASPMSHFRYTRAAEGTGYGLAAIPSQFFANRPDERSPIKGLYLCGASTRSGHGIIGALQSGWLAARTVAKDLGSPIIS